MEYSNANEELEDGFGWLQATAYSLALPEELVFDKRGFEYSFRDTIVRSNETKTMSLEAMSKFNDERKEGKAQLALVKNTIDSLSQSFADTYTFSDQKAQKLRWGTAAWTDGTNKTENEFIRVFTMSNINSQVILLFREKNITEQEFEKKADYIIFSVQLMEFGY